MSDVKLVVLYPQPTDTEQFEIDYSEHIALLHEKMRIPTDLKPYTVTKFDSEVHNPSPYYQMFSMPFPSAEALQQTLQSAEMQQVADDAIRISTGGAPVILTGSDAE
ncbi:EthD family reductase [Aliiglaciecola lipolytica]|uniref:Ethyl tert-butyl ether degradation EthD n=1 Tax=Aliiglaciecola lipolytica E3 TaxID=1127673 RepID=K6YD27_9ALTE|nr:EthD family reductase [Aliiglaciecola lipolytica]GAC16107.1 ethyl tert-butyl ether degradation EthD [Aliiglaciecola lipolytica E3]